MKLNETTIINESRTPSRVMTLERTRDFNSPLTYQVKTVEVRRFRSEESARRYFEKNTGQEDDA